MAYTEDFTIKCNQNNCNGIATSFYTGRHTQDGWNDIIVKYYNNKKRKNYCAMINMNYIADKNNIKDKFIYIDLERYNRYSKYKMIKKITSKNEHWYHWVDRAIRNWLEEHDLFQAHSIIPHVIWYQDLKTNKRTVPWYIPCADPSMGGY